MKRYVHFLVFLMTAMASVVNAGVMVQGTSSSYQDFSGTGYITADYSWDGVVSVFMDSDQIFDNAIITDITFSVYTDEGLKAEPATTTREITPFSDGLIIYGSLVNNPISTTEITYLINPISVSNGIVGSVSTTGTANHLVITANSGNIEIADITFVPEPATLAILAVGSFLIARRRKY